MLPLKHDDTVKKKGLCGALMEKVSNWLVKDLMSFK